MDKVFCLASIGLLVWLGSFSCGKYCTDGYKAAHPQRVAHAALSKPAHGVWRSNSAGQLADVYGLTPDSVAEPVEIFKRVQR